VVGFLRLKTESRFRSTLRLMTAPSLPGTGGLVHSRLRRTAASCGEDHAPPAESWKHAILAGAFLPLCENLPLCITYRLDHTIHFSARRS
jgi:hypothetical protein